MATMTFMTYPELERPRPRLMLPAWLQLQTQSAQT